MRLKGGNSFNQKITLFLALVIAAMSVVMGLKLAWRYL
jgi:hypothetical protein